MASCGTWDNECHNIHAMYERVLINALGMVTVSAWQTRDIFAFQEIIEADGALALCHVAM